jgi:acyl carrier protein
MTRTQEAIREILTESGQLAVPIETLDDNADLFAFGLDSLAIVNVLIGIEERFDIEFPDELLSRRSFSSITTLDNIVARLREREPTL